MIDPKKLQYYTMAHRMRGFADGLDNDRHGQLIHMLRVAASLLEDAWNEYQQTLPADKRVGKE
jgi:hypothetical protein